MEESRLIDAWQAVKNNWPEDVAQDVVVQLLEYERRKGTMDHIVDLRGFACSTARLLVAYRHRREQDRQAIAHISFVDLMSVAEVRSSEHLARMVEDNDFWWKLDPRLQEFARQKEAGLPVALHGSMWRLRKKAANEYEGADCA
jgi:hypothetical protein